MLQLQKVPLHTGNKIAVWAVVAISFFCLGWVGHALAKPVYCIVFA